mgnify:CR=1 FL=1
MGSSESDSETKNICDNSFDDTFKYALTLLNNYTANNFKSEVYHYSDGSGLKGICENSTLWLTDNLFLNDSMEVWYGLAATQGVLQSKINDKKIDKEVKEFAHVINEKMSEIVKRIGMMTISFCEDHDLLSQWHGYGKGKIGYSIGFNVNSLLNFGDLFLTKVIYDKKTQYVVLDEVVNKALNDFQELQISPSEIRDNVWYYRKLFAPFLYLASALKHPSFASENEWRLIKMFSGDALDFKCRISNDIFIPYYEYKVENLNDVMSSVTIGPNNHQILATVGLKHFLHSCSLFNVTVHESEIPFRRD